MRAFSLFLAASLALFALASRANAQTAVDLELVLAVDISYSMDYDELALQRDGYVQAITSKDFVDALRGGAHGKIAIIYIEWAGSHEQTIVVPWTLIDGQAAAETFAAKLAAAPVRRTYRTSISSGLIFSAAQFGAGFKGVRRVIDVSGDGTNNQGPLIEPTRDDIVAKGIVINGLPLQLKSPVGSMLDIPNLHEYYEDCVVGGPGSFVIPVRDKAQFVNAIRQKLVLEVSGIAPQKFAAAAIPAVKPPRVSCTIGEQMWLQRWGN